MKKNQPIQKIIKKIIDFPSSLLGLILLSPLFLITACLIKLGSKGPVFFRQERLGKNEKIFKIWKFRTMVENAENIGLGLASAEKDPRITKFGKFLREWTLDEWPQLFDVLMGKMSLVGPRPLPIYQGEKLSDIQKKRLTVLPGMVSLVDIKGRNLVSWEKRFEIDSWYIDNWSLWLDIKILFLIPIIILSRKGVYGESGKNLPPKNNMIVTIHQPEYLPWIGFFDRIEKADIFVLLDIVQYQKAGFMNRNKIKTAQGPQWITVPIKGGSRLKNINEIEISNAPNWQKKHWNKIKYNYCNAPYFEKYAPIFEEILLNKEWKFLSDLDCCLIETIMNILGIKTKTIKASSLDIKNTATELNIDICKKVGGDIYLSGPGGKNYMDMRRFQEENIKVLFQEFVHPNYPQKFMNNGFLPYLSIIDLLFNCGPKSLEIIKSSGKTTI